MKTPQNLGGGVNTFETNNFIDFTQAEGKEAAEPVSDPETLKNIALSPEHNIEQRKAALNKLLNQEEYHQRENVLENFIITMLPNLKQFGGLSFYSQRLKESRKAIMEEIDVLLTPDAELDEAGLAHKADVQQRATLPKRPYDGSDPFLLHAFELFEWYAEKNY